jgi:hypothetical protein
MLNESNVNPILTDLATRVLRLEFLLERLFEDNPVLKFPTIKEMAEIDDAVELEVATLFARD